MKSPKYRLGDPCPCPSCGAMFRPRLDQLAIGRGIHCSHACRGEGQKRQFADRFWLLVNKSDSCWLWTGPTVRGYGYANTPSGSTTAHHAVWQLVNGPIPEGLEVCHNCPGGDNRLCVNPAHMFLGTRLDNMRDALAKGRVARGNRLPQAKLTDDDVLDIRARYRPRIVTLAQLADEYGVDKKTIHNIIQRMSWTHI